MQDLTATETGDATVALSWTEFHQGDYDFNSLVTISDLTPLGFYFGQTVDRDAPGAVIQTQYWVDGDRNGEINLADLTPIGSQFGTEIAGYNIYRNGVFVPPASGSGPSIVRSDAEIRSGLPPRYSFFANGSAMDVWQVRPVDSEGKEGDPGQSASTLGLLFTSGFSGLDLLALGGEDWSGGYGCMRVILPGDYPDFIRPPVDPLDPGLGEKKYLGSGQTQIAELPAGQLLFADLLYAPTVDLASNAPRSPDFNNPGVLGVPDSYLAWASIPLSMSAPNASGSLSASVSFQGTGSGGYYVLLSSSAAGAASTGQRTVRLDYQNSVVSCDTDKDGDYSDEARLLDTDRDCISEARFEQEVDNFSGGPRSTISSTGIVTGYNELKGELFVDGVKFRFSELSSFKKRLLDDSTTDLAPSGIAIGDKLELRGYLLINSGKRWAEDIIVVADPGMKLTQFAGSGARPESFLDGGSAGSFGLKYAEANGVLEAQVQVTDAIGLRALYCELNYDKSKYRLIGYGNTGALEGNNASSLLRPAADGLYSIASSFPGMQAVQFGQSLKNPQSASGFSGSGALVSFYFLPEAEVAPVTVGPPLDPASAATLSVNNQILTWSYSNEGDFDQNGTVEPWDLRPLAYYFGTMLPPPGSLESLLDTDHNGLVGASDMSALSAPESRLRRVEEYRVYRSEDGGEYPLGGPNTVLLGTVSFAAHLNEPDENQLYFTYAVPEPVNTSYYWVRPVCSGIEGVASQVATISVP